jgi:glycerophosphoryl diester phosphodiesterase
MLGPIFNLQGHRGARGHKPGNTLPSFEVALDAGVTSIETDLHLTGDGHVIVIHDAKITERQCRLLSPGAAQDPAPHPLVSTLTRADLTQYVADVNADPAQFPDQDALATPAATRFAKLYLENNPFALPTLDDLFVFVKEYADQLGKESGKTNNKRVRAKQVIFDLELKRVPGRPERIGDAFDGQSVALLEERVLECIRRHGVVDRTVIRSFDHRSIRAIREREPRLRTAALLANTAPVNPAEVVQRAGASIYCLDVNFLDELQVRQLHASGIAVLPWTVNDPNDWERLLSWGVDGITTDYPDRLAALLRSRGIPF